MSVSLKKRGISPLIATVLLIGFVVAISLLAMLWGRTLVKEQIEKRAPISQQKLECQIDIEVDVTEACYGNPINVVNVKMENKRSNYLTGIKGRIEGSVGVQVILGNSPLYEYETRNLQFQYDDTLVGVPSTIQLMPMIYDEDSGVAVTCDQQNIMVTSKLYPC